MKNRNILHAIIALFFLNISITFGQDTLNVSIIDKIEFSLDKFEITGILYLPKEGKNAVVIWIHGDGPDLRTSRFPGTSFINTFLDNGFAYFRYDKPGYGDSKGKFNYYTLFQDRANIVSASIDKLKKHPLVDSTRIGLVGSSQAGYVMPLVLTMRNDITFMIGLSLPAIEGNKQWAYLLKKQMICEGYNKVKAEELSRMYLKLLYSSSHEDYLETIRFFEKNPINLSSLKGYDENFAKKLHEWWPLDWVKVQEFNPREILKKTKIPVLSVYGANDTQVDPQQSADAYNQDLRAAGNKFYEVKILGNADHNMSFSKTGCLKEQQTRSKSKMVPELPELIEDWLIKLKNYLN